MSQKLTPTRRARICTLHEARKTFHEIGCDPSNACRNYAKYHDNHDFYAVEPGRGRPPALTVQEEREACRMIRSGHAQTAADVQCCSFRWVAHSTMHRILAKHGLHGRHKCKVAWIMQQTHHSTLQMGQILCQVGCRRLECCNLLR